MGTGGLFPKGKAAGGVKLTSPSSMLIRRQNLYARRGVPVAVKHKAVEPVNKVKIIPVLYSITM
jgi:hypothetical protein